MRRPFEPVLSAAAGAVAGTACDASAYLYGSVTTGQARPARSGVDLPAGGLASRLAAEFDRELSARFSSLCRGVEIATATPGDLADEPYRFRVFLRYYCIHLAGPDHARGLPRLPPAPGDPRLQR